LVTIEKQ